MPATTESAAKYALIEKFSELFLQIYECKQAYIHAMDMAEEVNGIISSFYDILSEDENMQLEDLYSKLINGYMEGSLSAEDIQAIDLKKLIDFYPEEEDGYYLLRSMRDYFVFAHLVEGGQTEINAKLLTDINLSKNPALMELHCQDNPLTGLDVSKNAALTWLYCKSCGLTRLDVSNNQALAYLNCGYNQLKSLDVSKNPALKELYCYYNPLTSLDVSNNTVLTELNCSSATLTDLYLAYGQTFKEHEWEWTTTVHYK